MKVDAMLVRSEKKGITIMANDTQNYKVIVDENCPEHGGHNFAYQYDDENFPRLESICEDCSAASPHIVSPDLQAAREARSHERPGRA